MKVTEIQVLERAIKDAMKGGLSKLDLLALLPPGHTEQHIMVMLYDHRFLRGLFGYGGTVHGKYYNPRIDLADKYFKYKDWEYCGMQMLLSGDPLAYIAQNKYGVKIDDTEN